MDEVSIPFEKLVIDTCGPYPTSHAGNKYLLTFVHIYSGWPEYYAIPDKGRHQKMHQGPSQPFSTYCQLGDINLPPFTIAWLWRATTHTVTLLHYHIEIIILPFQIDMSLSRGHVYLTNGSRGHYPTRLPALK